MGRAWKFEFKVSCETRIDKEDAEYKDVEKDGSVVGGYTIGIVLIRDQSSSSLSFIMQNGLLVPAVQEKENYFFHNWPLYVRGPQGASECAR